MSQIGSGASKITLEEEQPSIPQIQGVPTAVFGVVGVAERGPIGTPVLCTSFDEYRRVFGRDTANGYLSHAARGYFAEGGQQGYFSRTVHFTDNTNAASKTSAAGTLDLNTDTSSPTAGTVLGSEVGPFDFEPSYTLVVKVDGGSNLTATFSATAASRDTAGAGPYTLSDGQVLTVAVDGGSPQSIAFLTSEFANIAAATRAEVAAVLNAKLVGGSAVDTGTAVRIRSDKRGTSSTINVTGGSANTGLVFTTGPTSGSGNVADIDAVTVAEVKTVVEAAVAGSTVSNAGGAVRISSNTTGGSSSIQVVSSSTSDTELGLDNAVHTGTTGDPVATLRADGRYDGTYTEKVKLKVMDATSLDAERFDLQVLDDGVVERTFTDLTMDEDDARYVQTVVSDTITGSALLTLTDLALTGSVLARRPANGLYGPLSGGDDGLVGLVDADFVGSSAGKTGLYALDTIADLSIIAMPDRATAVAQQSLITYCESWRGGSIFPILDPPAGLTAQAMVAYVVDTAQLYNSTEYGAIYWPRVQVANPSTSVYGSAARITVPPSGIIAGVYARVDASQIGGIYQPPAGSERGFMRSVLAFETDEVLDVRKRDLVFPFRINPLTTGRGQPRYIDGSRTLKKVGNFTNVAARRGVIFIEQSIIQGLDFARHHNNTDALRRRVSRTVDSFLNDQMKAGAFRSTVPAEAYFVDFGDGLNPDEQVFRGIMVGRIGLATNTPAEFIHLRVSQKTLAEGVS